MPGVSFAGDGGNDVKSKISTAQPSAIGRSKGTIDFAGDGGKDVKGGASTSSRDKKLLSDVPKKKPITLAGMGDKDL